jgi:methylated-DNA-[protein]-cysteine S-methyltransferase
MPGKIARDDQTRTISVFESDLGWIGVGWVSARIARLTFGHRSPKSAHAGIDWFDVSPADSTAWMRKIVRRIQRFTSGQEDDFLDIELHLPKSTGFQRAVLESCRRIPFGQTLSYGELASAAGYPRAARAVGNVMSSNRIPLIIPCHRVVGSAGSWGGYSARDGLKMKRRLLALEGAL